LKEKQILAIMGIKEEMHYKEISPQLFVCPPLHMKIGLVNKVWDELCLWVDQECELLSDEERSTADGSISKSNVRRINEGTRNAQR
jgi:hypothetical protein